MWASSGSLLIDWLVHLFNGLDGKSLLIGHARWIHEGQFVVKDLNLLVVCDFAGGNPDFHQRQGRVAAKEDASHSPRAVGRICDVRMVFGVSRQIGIRGCAAAAWGQSTANVGKLKPFFF